MKKTFLLCLLVVLISMFTVSSGMAMTLYGGIQYEINDGNGKLSLYYNGPGGAVTLLTQLGETPITVVGGYCFIMNSNNVTQLTIPNGYTTVENYAFHLGTSLLRVEIADSVTYLGEYAFDNCSRLEEVVLPSTLTVLNNGLFNGCKALGTIQIPAGVTCIGDFVFSGCSTLDNVTIPQGVISVGASAFQGCAGLTRIHLPAGVTEIQASTFSNCSALGNVSFSDKLTKIGDSAFENCATLEELPIPNTVTYIGSKAFSGCTSLGSVTIPSGIQFVGEKAFDNCPAERCAEIGSDGAKALGKAGYSFRAAGLTFDLKYVFDGDNLLGLEILNVPKDITTFSLPAYVTRIGKDAFRNCASLTQINLHESLNYIGANAFSGCESLTSVTVPNSVTEIHENAFSSCAAQRIASTGANGAKALGKAGYSYHDSQLDADLQYVYTNNECTELRLLSINKTLTSFTIPAGVTTISASAFENCVDLTEVIVPDTVVSIANNAFKHCDSLPGVDIPGSVASVGSTAFSYCPAQRFADLNTNGARALSKAGYSFRVKGDPFELKYLFTDGEASGLSLLNVDKSITFLQIPAGVTEVGANAAQDCVSLEKVTIPEGVTVLRSSAFNNSSSLTEISLPSTLTSIETYVFRKTALPSIDIPNGVTYVHSNAFLYSSTVKYAVLESEGAKALSKAGYSFRVKGDPFELKYLFTDGEVSGLSLLNVDKDITSLQIPAGVTEIGNSALKDCTALTAVSIPGSVTSIGTYAFQYCSALNRLLIPANVTSIASNAFANRSSAFTLLVVENSDAHTYAVTHSIPYKLLSFESLNTLHLPQGIKTIESEAFMNLDCEAVAIPAGCQTIGERAFAGCSYLVYVQLPSSVVSVADNAFEGCGQIIFVEP